MGVRSRRGHERYLKGVSPLRGVHLLSMTMGAAEVSCVHGGAIVHQSILRIVIGLVGLILST
eukprot:2051165-Amphidinium_carterae.1